MYESDTNAKVISGKWVLKPRKPRSVLRGFEDDVKDEDVVASTTMALSRERLQERSLHSVHCRRENRLPQRTQEGRRRGVRKATIRVATGGTGSQQGYCDLETTKESAWSGKLTERQDHQEDILGKCVFVSNMLDTCPVDSPRRRECHWYPTLTICC